jgi:hypothetical protein
MRATAEKIKKRKKNINQTDLFDLVEQLIQLEKINSELNATSALGTMELKLGDTKMRKSDALKWVQSSIDSII